MCIVFFGIVFIHLFVHLFLLLVWFCVCCCLFFLSHFALKSVSTADAKLPNFKLSCATQGKGFPAATGVAHLLGPDSVSCNSRGVESSSPACIQTVGFLLALTAEKC